MEEVSLEEYKELHDNLISGGMTEDEALEEIKKVKRMNDSNTNYENEETEKGITIRKQISKNDLLLSCCKRNINFDSLSLGEKNKILWHLGFNTKTAHFFEEKRQHRNLKGELVYGLLLVGTERLDKEWLKKQLNGRNVASDEARSYWRMKTDPGYREDIRNLSRR